MSIDADDSAASSNTAAGDSTTTDAVADDSATGAVAAGAPTNEARTVLVAGIDSSTQSCKVVVRDAATGRIVRSGRASHPDGTEVDPSAWWVALGTAVAAAGGLDDVAAVGIGGQQHGMVALDADGRVIRPALLWNDTRSAPAATALAEELGVAAWIERTGLVPVASFTGTKLRWLRDAEPEHASRVAAVALPHDWLSWRLRGYGPAEDSPLGPDLEALATDASDASGTAYWNPGTRRYDSELFERAFGVPLREPGAPSATTGGTEAPPTARAVVVPRVIEPNAAMGTLSVDVPLPSGVALPSGLLVSAGCGDNAAAALGLGLEAGDVAISLGTSGTVFGVTDAAVNDPSGTVAGFADATGARLPIVTTLNCARTFDVMSQLLGAEHDAFGQLALEAPPGSDGLVLVPWFLGERTPNRPDATAEFTGMTLANTTRAHLARASIEGVLCSLASGLAVVEKFTSVRRLLLIGGAARNAAVQAVAAQVFGRDIEIPEPGEYVAAGAALQAAWALTGVKPRWSSPGTIIAADPHPEVLATYRERAARI